MWCLFEFFVKLLVSPRLLYASLQQTCRRHVAAFNDFAIQCGYALDSYSCSCSCSCHCSCFRCYAISTPTPIPILVGIVIAMHVSFHSMHIPILSYPILSHSIAPRTIPFHPMPLHHAILRRMSAFLSSTSMLVITYLVVVPAVIFLVGFFCGLITYCTSYGHVHVRLFECRHEGGE